METNLRLRLFFAFPPDSSFVPPFIKSIYVYKAVMCDSASVGLSHRSREQGFQSSPGPYHAAENDKKIALILTF